MKTVNLHPINVFLAFLLGGFLLLQGCAASAARSQDGIPTLSMEEQVAATLAAVAIELTRSPAEAGQADAEENIHSVEITQEVPASGTEEPSSSTLQIPNEHYIYTIWGHRQYFPIGCEASAAMDWARYFGVEVNEFNFQYQLPQSDNPDMGFVGSVEGPWGQVPPYAYGVHAAPVALVLREQYGMNAQGVKDFTLQQLKEELAADRPVISWVIGNVVWGEPYEYTDAQGNISTVAAYEHVVIVTGYSSDTIRYMNNGKFYDIPTEYFLNSWQVLGNMVVYLQSE